MEVKALDMSGINIDDEKSSLPRTSIEGDANAPPLPNNFVSSRKAQTEDAAGTAFDTARSRICGIA
jgi:hypothetical protein